MARLADPRTRFQGRYDVVVIGSGYGGAIVAARLAAAGREVCILERGREWLPGDFPTDEASLAAAVRTPLNPLGLIDPNTQLANDLDVVVGNGLGGTSLINAAISLRPEGRVMEQPEWPLAIRRAHRDGTLGGFFDRAAEMLGAARQAPLEAMPKVRAHRSAVERLGVPWDTLPLNLVRDDARTHGVKRSACTHCGDCVAGCNVGAKNVLTTNYLPFAKSHGARIFVEMEARRIVPDAGGDGYDVHFEVHRSGATHAGSVRADVVVLAAGSLGSTEILMRSQDSRFRFSARLGERFSANADVMGMSYNGRDRTSALAGKGEVGTTLSSFGDYRKRPGPLDECFLLVDGAIPSPLVTLVARAMGTYALGRVTSLSPEQRERTLRDLVPFTEPSSDGALGHSLLYLACGHDSGTGKLAMADDGCRVTVHWPDIEKERCYEAIVAVMREHAELHGGLFIPNPRSTMLGGGRQMTVHPLGGCPMGDDASSGVVDHAGRVFSHDGTIHKGLWVADGAIVPRSLGVTPLLTISALAERVASLMLSGD